MRIAIQGDMVPWEIDAFDDALAARIASIGFQGIASHFGCIGGTHGDPFGLTREQCRLARSVADAHGLDIAYSWGFGASLVNHDDSARQRAVNIAREAIRVAADLGTSILVTGPGSNDPRSPWYPHPADHEPESIDRLITSLREVASAAEEHGVTVVLKGHVLSAVDTPRIAADVVDAVASPWVRTGTDPVNWLRLEHAFRSEYWIHSMFEALGDRVAIAHAKDYELRPDMVTRIDMVPTGTGQLDYATYLRLLLERVPDAWVVLESTATDRVPEAKTRLDDVLRSLGRDWGDARSARGSTASSTEVHPHGA